MAQPPARPVMARGLSRSIPFVTPRIFVADLFAAGPFVAEFDTLEGFADPNAFNNVAAYPGVNLPKTHAVGPYLDAGAFCTGAATILVEYAIDRGCTYHAPVPATIVPAGGFVNISGLRITSRFVRVTLTDTSGAANPSEFGAYVRSV